MLSSPVLHDTVTLRHFASVFRLDILQSLHGHRALPRWTRTVQLETQAGVNAGEDYCQDILDASWLDMPYAPEEGELARVFTLQAAMNRGLHPANTNRNLGEAESIFFAEKYHGQFATDDAGAYDFAYRHLPRGPARVIDTIDILRLAVVSGKMTASEAKQTSDDMEAVGRIFRPEHRPSRDVSYFHPPRTA